jgi:hypothetical protein
MLEQGQRGPVRAVQVVNHEQHRRVQGGNAQQFGDRLEHPVLPAPRIRRFGSGKQLRRARQERAKVDSVRTEPTDEIGRWEALEIVE